VIRVELKNAVDKVFGLNGLRETAQTQVINAYFLKSSDVNKSLSDKNGPEIELVDHTFLLSRE
jgi:hypothetical protein